MRMILAAVLLLLPLLCQAQSYSYLIRKYEDKKDVSSVYISRTMIEANPNLFTKDVYIGKVSGQLNSVQVLSTTNESVKKDMLRDIREWVAPKKYNPSMEKYDLLMRQKGPASSSEFYMLRRADKVKELIMIMDSAVTLKLVFLEGDMTLKDIQRIMMYQNTSWNDGNMNISFPEISLAECLQELE